MDVVEVEQDPGLPQVVEGSSGARTKGSGQEEELPVDTRRACGQPAEHASYGQGEHFFEGESHHYAQEE